MIAALGLLVGVVLGLIFTPDVPAGLEPYLPDRGRRRAGRRLRCASRLPRRDLRRQGVRRLVRVQRADRRARSSTWATSSASADSSPPA